MAVIRNIPKIITFYTRLKLLTIHRKNIEKYKAEENWELERENILKATRTWGTQIMKDVGANVTVKGKENIPSEGPVVFISNHQGYMDIPALCAVLDKFQIGFIAKQSLEKIPLYGKWAGRVRSVFILRESPRDSLKAIKKGIEFINDGFSLVIFPEGTRSKSSTPGEFKKGSTKLATSPKVPIVPISINGTYKLFEETGVFKGGDVEITIHPPIETKDLTKEEEKLLPEKVEKIVKEGLEKIIAEKAEENDVK